MIQARAIQARNLPFEVLARELNRVRDGEPRLLKGKHFRICQPTRSNRDHFPEADFLASVVKSPSRDITSFEARHPPAMGRKFHWSQQVREEYLRAKSCGRHQRLSQAQTAIPGGHLSLREHLKSNFGQTRFEPLGQMHIVKGSAT